MTVWPCSTDGSSDIRKLVYIASSRIFKQLFRRQDNKWDLCWELIKGVWQKTLSGQTLRITGTLSWVGSRVGHSVLFRSVRYVLLRSKKRTLRSFPFFLKFLATYQTPKERYVLFRSFLKNGKEREKRNILLQRTEKNGKNVTFFCKERKRTGERFVLLQKERENVTFFFRALRSLSKLQI